MLSFHLVCLSLHVWRDSCSLLTNFQSLFAKCESHTESTRLSFTIPDVRAKANTGELLIFNQNIKDELMSEKIWWQWFWKKAWNLLFVCLFLPFCSLFRDRYTMGYIQFKTKHKIKRTSFCFIFYHHSFNTLFLNQIVLFDFSHFYIYFYIFTKSVLFEKCICMYLFLIF